MAIETNAMAQAAQTLAKPLKTRRAPGAGRSVKNQGEAVKVTWDQIPALMKTATKDDDRSVASWVTLTDRLWVLGVRPSDFEVKDEDAKGLARMGDTYRRIQGLVIGSYTEKAQALLKAPTLALNPDQRTAKGIETDRLTRHLATILKYLKKLDSKDRGATTQSTLAESLIKELREMKDRIKRAKESRITFKVTDVLSCIDDVIDHLT